MEQELTESERLRKNLSLNIKKLRKKLGLSQEKLAEKTDLSSQTINDIEGCRMWVSDKTISKLARVLRVEAYQLLIPVHPPGTDKVCSEELLLNLEEQIIKMIRQKFEEALETSR